jgi:hypothetical protein
MGVLNDNTPDDGVFDMAPQKKQAARPAAGKGAARNTQKKAAPRKAAQPQTKPAPKKRPPVNDNAPGAVAWKMALILCCGLIVISLLFASVNGGADYVGLPDTTNTKPTPTPPVETVDPNLNVQGSDLTPIPAGPSPEAGTDADTQTQESPTP